MSSRSSKSSLLPQSTPNRPAPAARRLDSSTNEGADRRAENRAKIAEDDVEIVGASHAAADVTKPTESPSFFAPDFEFPNGHVITADDNLADNPLLAMTLLKVVALPKDMENLQGGGPPTWPSCASLSQRYISLHYFRIPFPNAHPLSYYRPGSVPSEPTAMWTSSSRLENRSGGAQGQEGGAADGGRGGQEAGGEGCRGDGRAGGEGSVADRGLGPQA